jgi:Zn-dependent protease with chaperone function
MNCNFPCLIMNIVNFYNSYPGMYITQSLLHSFIAALLVDASIQAWKIENPVVRQRFRLLVIVLPILSFPLYQVINPLRSSLSFRLDALFDMTRWLNLEIWRGISAWALLLVLLSFTTIVFIVQEIIPIIRHALASRGKEAQGERPAADSAVSKALAHLPDPKPEVFIIQDDDLILFVTTGKRSAIFISTGTAGTLTEEEIQTAIAHEIAHIERNKRPLLIVTFLLRVVQFFNPIALVEFRRIVQEEEKICDDIAITLTGKSQALADTLRKFHGPADEDDEEQPDITLARDRLEEFSHAIIIEERIARLEANRIQRRTKDRFALVMTCIAILMINYRVV